jgi:hypothetical protein
MGLIRIILCAKSNKYNDLCYDLSAFSYNRLATRREFASGDCLPALMNFISFANSGATCRRLSRSRYAKDVEYLQPHSRNW